MAPKKVRKLAMSLEGSLEYAVLLEVSSVDMQGQMVAYNVDTTDPVDLTKLAEHLQQVLAPATANQFKSFTIINAEHTEIPPFTNETDPELPLLTNAPKGGIRD